MMDFMDHYDGDKPFKNIGDSSHSNRAFAKDMQTLDDRQDTTMTSIVSGDKDYVQQCVRREEKRMLEETNALPEVECQGGVDFEETSQKIVTPPNEQLQNEQLTKIYKTYSFVHKSKENLSIKTAEANIVSMIETNCIIIIQGPTGCGKTTQVPQFILDSCFKKRAHCNIIVTQPRRIAAMSIAKRVSQERNWPIGTLVGFQAGMVNHTSPDTRLTYCTTGVLLRKLIHKKNMLDYTHVVIDEVHERDQEMDFLLLVVRKLQQTNSRAVRVILMSATINVDKFANYFSISVGNNVVSAPVIDINERNFFTVQVYYLCQIKTLGQPPEVSREEPKVSQKMMEFCIHILSVFDTIDKDCDHRYAVLIFLPGIHEIEEMHDLLTSAENEILDCDVVVLHSSITNEEQQHVFINPPEGQRRIILATNIAESSITMPDIKYVIDFCLTKQLVMDPDTNFQSLKVVWASKANCQQRSGRAGRLMDGRVYRLVPEQFYEEVMPDEGTPEMIRAPLENVVLNAKILGMGEPKAILALSLDPPNLSNFERTILLLKEAGALLNKEDEEISLFDGHLTDLGRIMAAMPMEIHITKLVVLGHVFSVLREATIIGASMAVKNMFSTPFKKKIQAYEAKLSWSGNSSSDCIAFLNVYNKWMFEKANNRIRGDAAEKRWARMHFLQIRVLREIEAFVNEITPRLRNLGIVETVGGDRVIWNNDELPLVLKIVIAGAFYPNYYTRSLNIDEKEGIRVLGGLDPTKTVYLQGWPSSQPGPLYARRIQEYFQDCVTSRVAKIHVTFDQSSRVYVQFRKNESLEDENPDVGEEPGEIPSAVYKAVKLRTIWDSIEIPVMYTEAANVRIGELGLHRSTTHVFLPKEGPIDEIPRPMMGIRPILPGLDISYIPLIIHRVISPSHFWAQLKDDGSAQNLSRIESIINSQEVSSLKEFVEAPKIGSLVLAPFTRGEGVQYFRAIVQNVSVESTTNLLAKLLYIDYGWVDRIPVCDLRQIVDNVEISLIPALAFECNLAEIRPSLMSNLSGQWSSSAIVEFHKLLSGDVSLFGEVYSVVNSIVRLKLIRVNGDEKLNINDELVKLGFAVTRKEDYLSRCNHELRELHADLPMRQREHHEELQYDQGHVTDLYPEPPEIKDCPLTVRLRGPYSPLEIGLISLGTGGIGKQINIEHSSVNSVILDTNPDDPHDRLLIAASINQSPSAKTLNLRTTTLMPNIPGLTSLLCLMFTPQMELRRNSMRNRYTGALCGLGYHPTTKNSFFPEHDLSIYFDVDITMDDLQEINRLRHWMSMGIYANIDRYSTDNAEQIAFCQNRVKDVLFGLLKKRRKPVLRELDSNFEKWCRYDDRLFIPPGRVVTLQQNIYRLHNALDINDKDDENEEIIAHIKELRVLMTKHFRNDPIGDVTCKICKVTINGVFQLRMHISTQEHKLKEEKYLPLTLS